MGLAEDAARRRIDPNAIKYELLKAKAIAEGERLMPQLKAAIPPALRTLEQHGFPPISKARYKHDFWVTWEGEDYIAWTLISGGGGRVYLLSSGVLVFHDLNPYIQEYGEAYGVSHAELGAAHGGGLIQRVIKAVKYIEKAKFSKLPFED